MAACLNADWSIAWRIRIGSWGGGCKDNLPLNSLATVIRPSALAHTHMQIQSHMEQPQVDKQASFLIPSLCLQLIQIFLSVYEKLIGVKLVSKDSMKNCDRSLFL